MFEKFSGYPPTKDYKRRNHRNRGILDTFFRGAVIKVKTVHGTYIDLGSINAGIVLSGYEIHRDSGVTNEETFRR